MSKEEIVPRLKEILSYYSGNFDGREGTRWRDDLLFVETKFGTLEPANDNGRLAREALALLEELNR